MSEPGQGRARGRGRRGRRPEPSAEIPVHPPASMNALSPVPVGRGRARSGASQAQKLQTTEATRSTAPEGHKSSGRGMYRSLGRELHEAPPVRQMASMSLSHGQAQGGGLTTDQIEVQGQVENRRRLPWERFIDHQWRQATLTKSGTSGKARKLLTNYVSVSMPQTTKVYQYHVSFKPDVENKRMKWKLVSSLSECIGRVSHFDGSILFLTRLLPQNPFVRTAQRTYDDATIEININYTCDVPQSSPQFLQIANGLLNQVQKALDMKYIKDNYFNMNQSVRIRADTTQLEVMPGFTTAIGKFDGGTFLNLDIVHKVLRVDTFYDVMCNLYMTNKDQFKVLCMKKYVGAIVLTRYNNKTYRVDGIDWDKRVSDTFDKNGTLMTYQQYYKEHWNLVINDDKQPLLITRPTERDVRGGKRQNLYLVPELCTITGLDEEFRQRRDIMNQLAFHTKIGPEKRVKTLETFLHQINSSEKANEVLNPWGMSVGQKVTEISSRELDAENLLVGTQSRITYDIARADWSRSMRNVKLLNPVGVKSWLIVYPDRCKQQAIDLSNGVLHVARGMGMHMNTPRVVELSMDRNEAYLQAIRQNLTPEIQIVVVVVMNDKKDRYDAIKKCCCIDNPVPSQVVVARTMKKTGFMSIATKILMQMNCKMGGEVWGADIPMKKNFMIIGVDSYHDSLHKSQSVGAMVATLNKQCTRFYCKTEMHEARVDTMSNLSVLVSGALRKFHEVNGAFPDMIILYRDGVGDGQLNAVFKSEKEQIDQAFKKVFPPDHKPGFAYVVVKKRINTRFFLPSSQGIGNPQPGTVVDSVVTKSEWYDFFLVSQSVNQGTVTPTSYNVIYDTTKLLPDHMQRMTYKMTHLYFNWQGTIRVPAVCQYAHKLAYLQGQSLHRAPSEYLADKLFFL